MDASNDVNPSKQTIKLNHRIVNYISTISYKMRGITIWLQYVAKYGS